jgi:hypothetical protein
VTVDNERKLFFLHEIFVSILKKLLVMHKAEIANLDKKESKPNSNKKYFIANFGCGCVAVKPLLGAHFVCWHSFCIK